MKRMKCSRLDLGVKTETIQCDRRATEAKVKLMPTTTLGSRVRWQLPHQQLTPGCPSNQRPTVPLVGIWAAAVNNLEVRSSCSNMHLIQPSRFAGVASSRGGVIGFRRGLRTPMRLSGRVECWSSCPSQFQPYKLSGRMTIRGQQPFAMGV